MNDVGVLYSKSFFAHRGDHSWRAPMLCSAIAETLNVRRIIDCGCGDGDLIAEFLNMGLDAWGIEGTENCLDVLKAPTKRVSFSDLRMPLPVGTGYFDLAMSLEVAEHIEEEWSDIYVSNLCRLAPRVIISAAPPGQKGHGHVNCQPPLYWIDKFRIHRFRYNALLTAEIKQRILPWAGKPGIRAYYNNLMVFGNGGLI